LYTSPSIANIDFQVTPLLLTCFSKDSIIFSAAGFLGAAFLGAAFLGATFLGADSLGSAPLFS